MRRVEKGALGMWTEVHFPNGDRVMVSMARNEIKIWKISRWGALFGRETLATIDIPSLMAVGRASSSNVRDELVANGVDPQKAAEAVPAGDTPSEVLDTTTALVSMWNSAEEVRAFDIAGTLAAFPRKP